EGPARNSLTIRAGRRLSVADAYLTPALDRPNLTLACEVVVDRIALRRDRARGVEAIVAGRRRLVSAPLVILAAGTVASPLVLMRSGVGPAGELGRHGVSCAVDL